MRNASAGRYSASRKRAAAHARARARGGSGARCAVALVARRCGRARWRRRARRARPRGLGRSAPAMPAPSPAIYTPGTVAAAPRVDDRLEARLRVVPRERRSPRAAARLTSGTTPWCSSSVIARQACLRAVGDAIAHGAATRDRRRPPRARRRTRRRARAGAPSRTSARPLREVGRRDERRRVRAAPARAGRAASCRAARRSSPPARRHCHATSHSSGPRPASTVAALRHDARRS